MKNEIMIVIHVNDLIFTEFNLAIIFRLKNVLNEWFEMNDLNSVASSDTEAELRLNHVMWLQSRDVTKVAVHRAG
jgi:uncharacterized SAM-dependent methyltransferase